MNVQAFYVKVSLFRIYLIGLHLCSRNKFKNFEQLLFKDQTETLKLNEKNYYYFFKIIFENSNLFNKERNFTYPAVSV